MKSMLMNQSQMKKMFVLLFLAMFTMLPTRIWSQVYPYPVYPQPYPGQWFAVQGQVFVTPYQVTLTVQNNWGYPMLCQGALYGQTYNGFVMSSPVQMYQPIPMGAYRMIAFLQNYNGFNTFVNGWAQVFCHF